MSSRFSGSTRRAYWYRVFIFLAGRDLPFVKKVTYYLHPTVSERERTVERTPSNPDCRLVTWLWGTFEVRALVEDVKGGQHTLQHMLSYDTYFNEETFRAQGLRLMRLK